MGREWAKAALVAAAIFACTSGAHAQQPPPSADAASPAPKQAPIDFKHDIQPIFEAHCVKCHGPEERAGGLLLDSREGAKRGGDSGKSLLDPKLEANELFARVSSKDRTYRMPKNAKPLADEQIERVRRWVAEGARWPAPAPPPAPPARSLYQRWLDFSSNLFQRYADEYYFAQPVILSFLGLLVLLLIVLRAGAAHRAGRAWAAGWLGRFCNGVKSREAVLLLVLSGACVALALVWGHARKLSAAVDKLNKVRAERDSQWKSTVYGWPPRPTRLDAGTAKLARTYYRGNCERNTELFNGGDYLTAIFRVALCDRERRPLEYGQSVSPDGVLARIEIERAPGTTDSLFSDELMKSVVLVKNFYEPPDDVVKEEATPLEALEPNWRWVAYVPLNPPKDGKPQGETIYVYTGKVQDGKLSGTLHYAVEYMLSIVDGKLAPQSDIWMDSFGNSAFAPPLAGKLPYNEWFSEKPMAVISGPNSTDPKLLGVDEYVKQGLIGPPEVEGGGKPAPPQDDNQESPAPAEAQSSPAPKDE